MVKYSILLITISFDFIVASTLNKTFDSSLSIDHQLREHKSIASSIVVNYFDSPRMAVPIDCLTGCFLQFK